VGWWDEVSGLMMAVLMIIRGVVRVVVSAVVVPVIVLLLWLCSHQTHRGKLGAQREG
jgi:hypothetical protein